MARGLEVWPTADVVTWDELIERAFLLDRQEGRATGRWLPASAAQLVWDRIVRDDSALDGMVSAAGIGRAAYQSWRRLNDYDIPPTALADEGTLETVAFARWCAQYRRWLESRGWTDVSLAQRSIHSVAIGPGLEIVGFDRLNPTQDALLQRWSAAGVDVRRETGARVRGRAMRVDCVDGAGEIDAAARWAANLLHGQHDLRVAIVVPDLSRRRADVRRIVERVFVPEAGLTSGPAPESRAFELAAARPLGEHPVVAAALDFLDVVLGTPDLPAVSRFLRNPFLADADIEGPARARLDARIRRFGRPDVGLDGLERLATEHGCPSLARVLVPARNEISKWADKDLPSHYSNYIFAVLSALGWPGSGLDSAEHQAAERCRILVSDFGSCDELTGKVRPAEAVGLLREMASRVLFEPQELRAPLLVIDAETSAGMRFDAIWVCGMDGSRWPPPAAPDPFLPRHLQLRHGLPRASADFAAGEARETLDRLLCSAGEIVLSVPQLEDDTPLLPSPLLAGIPAGVLPPGWPAPGLAALLHEARPPLESAIDARLPGVAGEERRRGGARLLELQAACPFRAQAELRLGARALDEPGVGVGAAERGDLVHVALASLWRELASQATLKALDASAVVSAVHRAVTAALVEARRSADPVLRHLLDLEAEWLEARVLEMVAIDRERPDFAIEAIEEPVIARIEGLDLELRPDRLDRLGDGSLAVIDYKTGASADVRAWLDERPRLPQLPAYLLALGPERIAAVSFARLRTGDTGYAGLARSAEHFPGLKVPGAKGGPKGFDSWEQLVAEWQRRLGGLAAEYVAGDARLAPNPKKACEYCHLGALCRIAETRGAAPDEEVGEDE
jgi:ATP-dependent helicase/nuclease subunit B